MPIDTSIYQAIKPTQVDPAGSVESAMKLSQMGLQMQTQQAMRQAYADNVGPDGQLNQQGFLSSIGRVNPQAAIQMQQSFVDMNKKRADMQSAQVDAVQKQLTQVMPSLLDFKQNTPDNQKATVWPQMMAGLRAQGVDTSRMGDVYDPQILNMALTRGQNAQDWLTAQKTKSDIGLVPVQKQAALYGSRSPNAELTSQFNKDISPVLSSQMAMRQMIDNYKNPSPQGDASLILNAFKIKFPTAPDVNSLEELSKSQAASDTWKNMAHKALAGGLDANTRDNLMRDGISTFRANYGTYKDTSERYKARQAEQGVNDPTLTYQPGIENTFKDAMALQDKVGPYVPPTERGGISGAISKVASSLLGGKSQKADNDGVAYAAPAGGGISAHDAAALQWVQNPKNASSPQAFKIRSMLKQKGLIK